VAIAGQFVREAAHVAGTLHVVLPAQRIDADALAAEVTGGHGKVGDGDHRGRALGMLGDAEAVVDRRIAAFGVKPRRRARFGGRHAAGRFQHLRRIGCARDELAPVGEGLGLAAFGDESLVHQALGDDDVGHGRQNGDIGAGLQLQMMVGPDMGRTDQIDGARIDDDEPRTLAHPSFEAGSEHRMGLARIGADHHDHVGQLDGLECLRPRRLAQRLLEAIAGRRVADAGTGINVVVAESRAHQLLHQIVLFIGATAGDDGADRVGAVLLLDAAELARRVGQSLLPRHFAPGITCLRPDHRPGDAVRVRRVAPGEAALDAGVALVGAALPGRHHAHHLVALHFGVEAATDTTIGASRRHATLRLTLFDDGFFHQCRRRTGLDAGAAGNTIRLHEGLALPRRDARTKAAAGDGDGEAALLLLAGAHAAVADDALGRVIAEIGVGLVLRRIGEMIFPGVCVTCAVTHLAQAHHPGHGLQLAVAVRGAGQAIQRMVGDIELHHIAP
jgi:hypothetical protein